MLALEIPSPFQSSFGSGACLLIIPGMSQENVSLTEPSATLGEGTIRAHVYCWEWEFGGGRIFLSGLNVIFEFCLKGDEDGSELEKCALKS